MDPAFTTPQITFGLNPLVPIRLALTFGYSDAVDIFVNGQKVFQGDATYIRRDIQFLGTVSMRNPACYRRALWLRA